MNLASNQIVMLITIAAYMLAMVGIGIYYANKNKNTGDYYLGGRQLGPFVTAMSAEATDMSGWLLMGLPGVAYATGVPEALWTAVGLAIGTYLNWLFVAKRLRRYTYAANNSITIPEFFSNRYGDKSKLLMCISALMIFIFFVPYTASGFVACGKIFSTLFDVPYVTAMIISAVIILIYTAIGGFMAASTTDFIQGILMTAALIGVLFFGVHAAGGMGAVIDNASQLPGYLDAFKGYNYKTGEAADYGFLPVVSTLAWGLGYFGMPAILLRFMAIRDEREVKTARRVASVWVVVSLAIAVMIGIIGLAALKNDPLLYKEGENWVNKSENVISVFAIMISEYGWFFAILGGLIIAGMLAATMSTADSQMLAASSSVSEDLFKGKIYPKLSEKAAMWLARGGVILITILGVILALNPDSSVFKIVSFAWAGFGAAFGPLVLCALFWKRSNKWGALASMLSGGTMVFVWKFAIAPMGGAWAIYELLPAFIVALIANVVVSLLTKAPSKEITDIFELVRSDKPLD